VEQEILPTRSQKPEDKVNEVFGELVDTVGQVISEVTNPRVGQCKPEVSIRMRELYHQMRILTGSMGEMDINLRLPIEDMRAALLIERYITALRENGFYTVGRRKDKLLPVTHPK